MVRAPDTLSSIAIGPAGPDELGSLLPLIAAYQRFYGVDSPDDERNRSFFGRFVPPGDEGLLLGAWDGDDAVGFACVYFRPESVSARDVAHLHDLYTVEAARGRGVGRALIDRALDEARSRGFPSLDWQTAIDNRTAQRLYETYDGERTTWFEYEVDVPGEESTAR